MASIFAGPQTIRTQYVDVLAATITGKTEANAIQVFNVRNGIRMLSITNNLDVEMFIALINPEDTTQTKQFMMKIGPNQWFTIDAVQSGMLEFPAGTGFYYHTNGVAAASGKVRTFIWGL